MDFISTLYETFSGQTLGRPDKKHKKKLRNQRGVSVAKSPILMSLKSPQKGKVAKKKSTVRPNLKSITNTSNNNKPEEEFKEELESEEVLQPNEDVSLLTKYLLCEEEHKEVV